MSSSLEPKRRTFGKGDLEFQGHGAGPKTIVIILVFFINRFDL
jgi:hypothetical protein